MVHGQGRQCGASGHDGHGGYIIKSSLLFPRFLKIPYSLLLTAALSFK